MLSLLSVVLLVPLRGLTLNALQNGLTETSGHRNGQQQQQQQHQQQRYPDYYRYRHRGREHEERQRHKAVYSESCRGVLSVHCVCVPDVAPDLGPTSTLDVKVVTCNNVRLVETSPLLDLRKFPKLEYANFHGNNLGELPERMFGGRRPKPLQYLNLSDNSVLYLHQDTLIGLSSLHSLDLSQNSLQLRSHVDAGFLRPLRFLKRLLLRHAFQQPSPNITEQMLLLVEALRQGKLRDLEFLDLSDNRFENVEPSLTCWTPALTHLNLADNRLTSLRFENDCPVALRSLDLRNNRLAHFDSHFARTAAHFARDSVLADENPFECYRDDCAVEDSLRWMRSTWLLRDKERLLCRASPQTAELIQMVHAYPDNSRLCLLTTSSTTGRYLPIPPSTVATPAAPPTLPDNTDADLPDGDIVLDLMNVTAPNNSASAVAAPVFGQRPIVGHLWFMPDGLSAVLVQLLVTAVLCAFGRRLASCCVLIGCVICFISRR